MTEENDPELAVRIRQLLADAASGAPDTSNATLVPVRRAAPSRGRWLAAAAALVLVVLGITVLATRNPDAAEPSTAPETTATDTTTSDTSPTETSTAQTSTPTSIVTASSVPSTSAPVVPPPTGLPTSTTQPIDLTLRPDGIGGFDFGSQSEPVLAAVISALGAPDYEENVEFGATAAPDRWIYETRGFAHRFGRVVCRRDVFCLYFGGPSLDERRFVGWWYYDTPVAQRSALSTADGISLGSRVSDHLDSIVLPVDGQCYSAAATSTVDGIDLGVRSVGVPFFAYDTTGAFIEGNPPPEDLVVTSLSAGEGFVELDADC